MLAGCSSTLVSPRHRLRSDGTMSTQRLDIPCGFGRKDGSRSQSVRPVVGLSIEKPTIEAKASLSQNIKLAPLEIKREKKRFAERELCFEDEETYMGRVKRKRSVESIGSEGFWFSAPESNVPLPPLSNIPWFDSVVTQVTDLGKGKEVETIKETSGSSTTSSGSQGLVVAPTTNPTEHEAGNGNGNGSSPHNPGSQVGTGEHSHREHEYFELITLLVACAEQIGSKNIAAVNHCLARLGELASPRGSPIHRLIAYFTEALTLRVARLWPHIFHISAPREIDDDNNATAMRILNQVSPIPNFIHFTSNEVLLRAFHGKDRVHIIDFDIKQGLQWSSLFQSLASRPDPPSHVRITGVGESKQELIETGDRLARFAAAFNLPFEFHSVVDRLEDVRLWMLHVKEKETVAVNCVFQLHKMLYDGSEGALRDLLGLIRSTNAEIVVTAEQEAAHNEASMDARLFNSLRYYSALFDSVDSALPLDSPARIKIEEMFAREIRNIIGCEGRERTERHQSFETWQEMMERGGFRCAGMSEREVLQGEMMLKMYANGSYRVEKREIDNGTATGGLTLCWLDQPLYTVAAWTPADAQ